MDYFINNREIDKNKRILIDSLDYLLLRERFNEVEFDFLRRVKNLYTMIYYSNELDNNLPSYESSMRLILFKNEEYQKIRNNKELLAKVFIEAPNFYTALEMDSLKNKGSIANNRYLLNTNGSWELSMNNYKLKVEDFRREKAYILKVSKEYENEKEEIYVIDDLNKKKIVKRRISF